MTEKFIKTLKKIEKLEDAGYIVYDPKSLNDKLKFEYFLTVLDQYSLQDLENLIPNKNEDNNHKN